ncbi:MAG: archaeosortase H [Promethearchaeota archaeon]|jgi:exosortase/archaeosortase family protein
MKKFKGLKNFKKPIIEFDEKKYIFSIRSLIFFALGAPISAWLIYLFFNLQINHWLHEVVVKQTTFFLNLFFNMNAEAVPVSHPVYSWSFQLPVRDPIFFETFCTGVQAIVIFIGVIVFTPHSQDVNTKRDVIWRKTKSLIISSLIFYIVNIIRMLIQIQLYNIGYAWDDIHFSISAASSFIAAIIVLLMHRWIPEFIISIIYIGTLVSQPIKQRRKTLVKNSVNNSNKVKLKIMRKILRMDKKTFSQDIVEWSKNYGYGINDDNLIIPPEETSHFIELLMQDKSFQKANTEKN